MKKTTLLSASMLAPVLLPSTASASAEEPKQPNVIIILADDLGYGDMEPYGATRVKTPAVNRLAEEGTTFTNVHAVAATSTPSR